MQPGCSLLGTGVTMRGGAVHDARCPRLALRVGSSGRVLDGEIHLTHQAPYTAPPSGSLEDILRATQSPTDAPSWLRLGG